MKKISVVMMTIVFSVLTLFKTEAQDIQAAPIAPYHLGITWNKTTSLVFPYAIKSVDKGSRDVLVQKAVGVENILQLKAAKQGFSQTNLTVVTADGSLFAYVLDYTDAPASLSLQFNNLQKYPRPLAVFAKDATTDEVALKSQEVAGRERTIKGIRDENFNVALDVTGVYIYREVMYFQLALQNKSTIDYDIQSLRFSIHDKKRSKRTASQEIELQPVFVLGNTTVIRHNSEQSICVALPKFTIPDKKYLSVQLMEQNGGRHLSVKINNKTLVRGTLMN